MPVHCLPCFLRILMHYVILMGLMKAPLSAVQLNEREEVEIIHLAQDCVSLTFKIKFLR